MSNEPESTATRLWRDRVQIREQERNDAQARARIAEDKVAVLMAENDQLMAEITRLRSLLTPDAGRVRTEAERQMAELRGALLPLLAEPSFKH
jgi:hypothetical protein